MEINKNSVQLEELSIEKVCRTCLNTNDESMIALHDYCEEDILNKFNFSELINQTFGRIMPLTQNLPNRLCSTCQKSIKEAFNFKKQCMNSTQILSDALDNSEPNFSGFEDKYVQTEHHPFMQIDDENYDSINLQEDVVFESPAGINNNPFGQESCEESLENCVKTESMDMDYMDQLQNIKSEMSKNVMEIFNAPHDEPGSSDDENEATEKNYSCDKCSKTFTRSTHLKRHQLLHNENKLFHCSMCSKGFSRVDHLNHHILNSHTESKPFACEIADCRKGFMKEDHLRKHIEAKHNEAVKQKETCTICQKTFSSKKYLKTHMKVHSTDKTTTKKDQQNEKPFLCSECGLRFVRNDYLVIHMRRHLGVKPYKCRYCDKGFPRATDLTVHERYHTNEKTHLCNLCGKGFQRAYNLLVHMRVHTGEKPYSCSYCSKSFSQGNDLKAHIRRHTGERFKCEICNEGFIQGYHLRNHKKTVHGIDIKSHIRRVEKFINPATTADNSALSQNEIIQIAESEQNVKIESTEYQQFPAS